MYQLTNNMVNNLFSLIKKTFGEICVVFIDNMVFIFFIMFVDYCIECDSIKCDSNEFVAFLNYIKNTNGLKIVYIYTVIECIKFLVLLIPKFFIFCMTVNVLLCFICLFKDECASNFKIFTLSDIIISYYNKNLT